MGPDGHGWHVGFDPHLALCPCRIYVCCLHHLNMDRNIVLVGILSTLLPGFAFAQANSWNEKASFPGAGKFRPFSCSMNSMGYLVAGGGQSGDDQHTWAYDPGANTWTQKSDFGGGPRFSPAGFVINGRAYVGGGLTNNSTIHSDFWSYDPTTDVWQQIANCPGPAKYDATGFTIGNIGYICCGSTGSAPYTTSMYAYDPMTGTWTQKASLPGLGRSGPHAFVSMGKAYVIGGWVNPYCLAEVWAYDPASDTWTQKNDLPAERADGEAFAIYDHGYFGGGFDSDGLSHNDFWEYVQTSDTWIQRANYGGPAHHGGAGFAIDGYGYMGAGMITNAVSSNELWQYGPTNVGINVHQGRDQLASVRSLDGLSITVTQDAPSTLELTLYDLAGQAVYVHQVTEASQTIRPGVAAGIYLYQLMDPVTKQKLAGRLDLTPGQ
jgi:N-acetylneuraminic acid mutarotase